MAKPKKYKGVIGKRVSLRNPSDEVKRDECGMVPCEERVTEEEYQEHMRSRMSKRVKKARIPITKI